MGHGTLCERECECVSVCESSRVSPQSFGVCGSSEFWYVGELTAVSPCKCANAVRFACLCPCLRPPASPRRRQPPSGGTPQLAAHMSSFWAAAHEGDIDRLRELLDQGQDLDAYPPAGDSAYRPTALAYAVWGNQPDAAMLLLEYGANPNKPDGDENYYPLHWASYHRDHADCAQILVEAGADLNVRSYKGYTPLQLAMGENGLVSRKPGVTAVLEEAARNPYPPWVPPRGRAGAGGRRGAAAASSSAAVAPTTAAPAAASPPRPAAAAATAPWLPPPPRPPPPPPLAVAGRGPPLPGRRDAGSRGAGAEAAALTAERNRLQAENAALAAQVEAAEGGAAPRRAQVEREAEMLQMLVEELGTAYRRAQDDPDAAAAAAAAVGAAVAAAAVAAAAPAPGSGSAPQPVRGEEATGQARGGEAVQHDAASVDGADPNP